MGVVGPGKPHKEFRKTVENTRGQVPSQAKNRLKKGGRKKKMDSLQRRGTLNPGSSEKKIFVVCP